MNEKYNKVVYTLLIDCKGYPYIEANNLAYRIAEAAEETTSPRGVEPKMFVDGCSLKQWGRNGRAVTIQEFATEEEAQNEWLERTYQYDYLPNCYNDYDCLPDAVAAIAEQFGIDTNVAESLLVWHAQYRDIEARKRAAMIEARVAKAEADAAKSGKTMTKNLYHAIMAAKFPSCYMYGRTAPYGSPRLKVEMHYNKEFKNKIDFLTLNLYGL